MNKITTTLSLLAASLSLQLPIHAADSLEAGFKEPPISVRPMMWYTRMNGHITREGTTRDLEAMAQAGIGGFQMFDVSMSTPPGEVPYNSPQWHGILRHTLDEAERLGLSVGFHVCAGWSAMGGPWVEPRDAMKELVWSPLLVEPGSQGQVRFQQPTTRAGFYEDAAVIAFPSTPGRIGKDDRDSACKTGS